MKMPNKESNNIKTSSQNKSGRPKGSLNKKSEHIFELCEKNNFDPVERLIYFAMGDWKKLGLDSKYIEKQGYQGVIVQELSVSIEIMKDATKDLMSFMYPKRKAVELSGDQATSQPIVLAYSKEGVKDAAKD